MISIGNKIEVLKVNMHWIRMSISILICIAEIAIFDCRNDSEF